MLLPVTEWNRRKVNDGLMRVANVPMRKWGSELDQVPGDPPYLGVVRDYLVNLRENLVAGDGLLLWGDYRTGKSSLAACIVREVAAFRCRPYWLLASELADGWEEQDHRYDRMREAQLVVVDDLGTEGNYDFRKDMIRRALRYRLENAGATIITTNMDLDGLGRAYGEKLKALLRECVLPVCVEGVDWGEARKGVVS